MFKRSVYWNEYKTKSESKNATNEYRYFLESKLVDVIRLIVLIFSNQDNGSKRYKRKRYYLPNRTVYDKKTLRFNKNQEDSRLEIY